ncbi:MAG: HD domain-containing protein [Treponema sp.]|nr:HD domain-containing protein [Treponema sp.]
MSTPESVIEIGSTGVRLLVAEVTSDKKQNILDRAEMPLPLGKDVFTSGVISQETSNLLVQILKRYKEQLMGWGITPEQSACFASIAFRDAKNCDPILDRVLVQTGFKIKIIDGIEENRLMYLAVADAIKDQPVDFKNDDTVILVVGGSTSEMMMMSDGKMAGVHSLKIGTVRIDHHMGMSDEGAYSYENVNHYIEESINNTKGSLESELNLSQVKQFIAVGHDVTLAALQKGKPISTFLWEIKKEDFESFVMEIQKYTIDECRAKFKIPYHEAETLQLSLLIYSKFMNLTQAKTLIVPETNIRNGYILSKTSSENDELQKEFDMQITASARNLLRKYHGDENHAECVRMISTKLYDTMKNELAMDDHARTLLETAAILHDIGVFIRYDNHNIHGSYIVQNSEIFGLNRIDKTIVAEITRFHKGSIMPQDSETFLMLPRSSRMMILKLTAILRIADALDRGHIQKFTDFSITLEQNSLIIHTKKGIDTVLEKIALSEKAGMFESVFGYKVILL